MTTGIYKHFKGNLYTVYGSVKTTTDEDYILYRANYGTNEFWIRPIKMFFERIKLEDGSKIQRFNFVSKIDFKILFSELTNLLKEKNIIVHNSETSETYMFYSINEDNYKIVVAKNDMYSAYLTDTQMANRMGFDLYKINNKTVVNKTCMCLNDRERFEVVYYDDNDNILPPEDIIKNQMNSCSLDLHISNEFYKSRHKKIDMSNIFQHAVKPSALWKKIYLKNIGGTEGIVLWPNQSIITCTHEEISLPENCAGKIEIKSTYARLSLSVTASDFCNPGWKGKFPLTIKNHGNNRIVIHPKERMLQISLIPTQGAIVNEYSQNGVFMDDDGTPFKFWRSQTVKRMGSREEQEKVLAFYQNVIRHIEATSSDVESEKERFENTFLSYYGKKRKKKKYKNIRNIKEKLNLLWKKYKEKERAQKFFFSKPVKFSAIFVALLPVIISCMELYTDNKLPNNFLLWIIISVVLVVCCFFLLFFKAPNSYCTFERLEFDKIYGNNA